MGPKIGHDVLAWAQMPVSREQMNRMATAAGVQSESDNGYYKLYQPGETGGTREDLKKRWFGIRDEGVQC